MQTEPLQTIETFDAEPVRALVLDLLAWVAREPRTYSETLEAWRTSCPRLPVWEEAVERGFVCVVCEPGLPMRATPVSLTPDGHALLRVAGRTAL
ncbi:MAG: hypothetical protein DCC58_02510 [Chloroflexi bacterium]|nr:MAG: hypothetical protein DCC58_02510 [Chloroflexota bacterium]